MNRQLLWRSPERSSQWRWRSLLLALLCLLCLPSMGQSVDESKVITLTTKRQAGQTIQLEIRPRGNIRVEGVQATNDEFTPNSWNERTYTLTQSTVRVFGDIKAFICRGNQLTALDVSHNTTLESLMCEKNELTELDLSRNETLSYLACDDNQLSRLDLEQNGALETVICRRNQLTDISLPNYGVFEWLNCPYNKLSSLDLRGQTSLKQLDCEHNELSRLDINSSAPLRYLKIWGNSLNQEAMDRLVAQLPQIPEENKSFAGLFIAVDTKGQKEQNHLSRAAASLASSKGWQVRDLNGNVPHDGVAYEGSDEPINKANYARLTFSPDIVGQEIVVTFSNGSAHPPHFEGAQLIRQEENPEPLQSPLYHLRVEQPQVRIHDPYNLRLKDVEALMEVDFSQSPDLTILGIANAPSLTQRLDLSSNSKLVEIKLSHVGITSLELNQSESALVGLYLEELSLPSLNLNHQNKLHEVRLKKVSLSSGLNVAELPKLISIDYKEGSVPSMTVRNCPMLGELRSTGTQLKRIEVENTPKLWKIDLKSNQLEELDMNKLIHISEENVDLDVSHNRLKRFVSGKKGYTAIYVNNNQLEELDLSTTKEVYFLSAHANKLKSVKLNPDAPILTASVMFNNLDLAAMSAFVDALPHYKVPTDSMGIVEEQIQRIYLKGFHPDIPESNIVSKTLVEKLKEKGWIPAYYKGGFKDGYEGDDADAGEVYYSITTGFDRTMGSVSLSVDDPAQVQAGTEVTVTATPAEGYELASLTANGTDIMATKRFTIDGNTMVLATFRKLTYSVAIDAPEHGTIRIAGADDLSAVPHGTTLSVEISPEDGYELATLTANGTDISTTLQFVVTSDTRVAATFRQTPMIVQTYAVTLEPAEGGTILIEGKTAEELEAVAEGTTLSVVATPAEGYELASLTANGVNIMNTKAFVVNSDTRVAASFEKQAFSINLPEVEHAKVAIKGNPDLSKVPYGTELELDITPDEGYELAEVKVNGQTLTAPYRFRVDGEINITIKAKQRTYQIQQSVEGQGVLSITGASDLQAVLHGTQLNVVATPAEGYELAALTANGVDIKATKTFAVTSDTRVEATFTKRTFAVQLPEVEHAKVAVKGNPDLSKVAYGTELELEITPDEGFEVAEIKVNGQTLAAPYRVRVDGEISITIKMKDATAIGEVKQHSVRLYPNPATSYIIVEGVKEGEPIRLINLGGRVVLEQRQNASGQLSVSHLVRGVYLLQVQGTTQRVLLQ